MEYEIKEQYRIWLSSVKGITPKKYKFLMETLGDAQPVWDDPECAREFLDEKTFKSLKQMRSEEVFFRLFYTLEKSGITAISCLHTDYPETLLDLYDPPPVLYISQTACWRSSARERPPMTAKRRRMSLSKRLQMKTL